METERINGTLFIRGKNVELRAIEPEDYMIIDQILNAPQVSSCLFGYPLLHKGMAAGEWLKSSVNRKNAFYYAVKETQNFATVGVCAYQEIDYKNGSMTVCVAIAPEYTQDSVYGVETLRALSRHGFYQLRMEHIALYCIENDHLIEAWAQEAGFSKDAVLYSRIIRGNKRLNLELYSLLKEEGEL